MKTDDLIAMLATNVAPVKQGAVTRRLLLAVIAGAVIALLLVTSALGIRPDIRSVSHAPLFWIKMALPLSLLLSGLWACTRLARPGVAAGVSGLTMALPFLVVWIAAIAIVLTTPAADRLALILGHTWRVCPLLITALSIPAFIAIFCALKGLAPTRLRAAGAAGGLLAGATATLAYCLHCPEMAVPFWAIWYVLGMLIPTVAGALLGPRFLRWR